MMVCFGLGPIENLLIWLVVIGAIFALIRLLLPLAAGPLGAAVPVIIQALYIIIWAIVMIAIIIVVFELIECLLVGHTSLR